MDLKLIKQQIKDLATEQPILKNQKKTVNLVGERILDSNVAINKHYDNRSYIRHLHVLFIKVKLDINWDEAVKIVMPNKKDTTWVSESFANRIYTKYEESVVCSNGQ